MAGESENGNQINPRETVAEICDFCWDDSKQEVPAVSIEAGIPLCARHLQQRRGQTRFAVAVERKEESVTFPEPKIKRAPAPVLTAAQMKARQDAMKEEPKSLQLFKPGGTEDEFAKGLGTLMQDVISGRVSPEQSDAACKVADRVIRIIEMRIKQDWKENGGGDLKD